MAKKRTISKHSRAARRATSPSIDTDRSLKDVKPPPRTSPHTRPSVLAVQRSAGVSKKTKPTRKTHLSAKARRRHEKGLEMAEAVVERTSMKMQRSLGRERTVKDRSRAWEKINKDAEEQEEESGDGGGAEKAAAGWETDEELEDAAAEDAAAPSTDAAAPVDDDDDVIL